MDPLEIPGLFYESGFVAAALERRCVEALDAHGWSRRPGARAAVQSAGYSYEREGGELMRYVLRPELPPPIAVLAGQMRDRFPASFSSPINAMRAVEYTEGQHVSEHIDTLAFGPVIAIASLLSSWTMSFRPVYAQHRRCFLRLERCSLLVLTQDARYVWEHGIPEDQGSPSGGDEPRRISVSLRCVPGERRQTDIL